MMQYALCILSAKVRSYFDLCKFFFHCGDLFQLNTRENGAGVINVSWCYPLIRGSACSPFGKGRGMFRANNSLYAFRKECVKPEENKGQSMYKDRPSLKKYRYDFNISG